MTIPTREAALAVVRQRSPGARELPALSARLTAETDDEHTVLLDEEDGVVYDVYFEGEWVVRPMEAAEAELYLRETRQAIFRRIGEETYGKADELNEAPGTYRSVEEVQQDKELWDEFQDIDLAALGFPRRDDKAIRDEILVRGRTAHTEWDYWINVRAKHARKILPKLGLRASDRKGTTVVAEHLGAHRGNLSTALNAAGKYFSKIVSRVEARLAEQKGGDE